MRTPEEKRHDKFIREADWINWAPTTKSYVPRKQRKKPMQSETWNEDRY